MAGRLYDTGAISLPDYIQKRYNPLARKIASYSVLCMGISSLAAQFRSVGSMSQALGLCDANTGIIIGAIVILLFTVFSGLWGVAITDTIQSIMILAVVGFVIPIAATVVAGGPKEAIAAIDPRKALLQRLYDDDGRVCWLYHHKIVFRRRTPAYSQRVFAAKTARLPFGAGHIHYYLHGDRSGCCLAGAVPQQDFPGYDGRLAFCSGICCCVFPHRYSRACPRRYFGLLLTTGDTFLMLFFFHCHG